MPGRNNRLQIAHDCFGARTCGGLRPSLVLAVAVATAGAWGADDPLSLYYN